MTNPIDRYGFHSNNTTVHALKADKAGVSVEFVHNRVVGPLEKYIRSLEQADKFAKASNANREANRTAITLLTACKNNVESKLSDTSTDEIHHESNRTLSR